MPATPSSIWDELSTPSQRDELTRLARRRRWGLSLILVGWLHLLAFSICYYLTIARGYNEAPGYLALWVVLNGIGLGLRAPSVRTLAVSHDLPVRAQDEPGAACPPAMAGPTSR